MLTKRMKALLEAYRVSACNVSAACRKVGIKSRKTFYNLYQKNQEFREKVDEIREELLDLAETRLFQIIDSGNLQAITFFLTNKGAHRGWKYRHTLDATIELPKVILVDEVQDKQGKQDEKQDNE